MDPKDLQNVFYLQKMLTGSSSHRGPLKSLLGTKDLQNLLYTLMTPKKSYIRRILQKTSRRQNTYKKSSWCSRSQERLLGTGNLQKVFQAQNIFKRNFLAQKTSRRSSSHRGSLKCLLGPKDIYKAFQPHKHKEDSSKVFQVLNDSLKVFKTLRISRKGHLEIDDFQKVFQAQNTGKKFSSYSIDLLKGFYAQKIF